jgi:hypothetical protein
VSGDTADPGDPGVVFAAWARCRGRGPGLNECRFAFVVFTATEKLLIVVEGIVEKKKTSKRYAMGETKYRNKMVGAAVVGRFQSLFSDSDADLEI